MPKCDLLGGCLSVATLQMDPASSFLFRIQPKALPKPNDIKHRLLLASKNYGLISHHEYSELRAYNTVIW